MDRETYATDGGRRTAAGRVLAIDLAVVVGLVLVGQVRHGGHPVSEPVATLEAVAPFVVGWLVVSYLAGLYDGSTAGNPLASVRATIVSWLAASNVGFLLRGTPYLDGSVPWSFMAVFAGFGVVAFVIVRGVYEYVRAG